LTSRLAQALAAEADVQLAVVFGSAARGTERPASDLDLGVIGPASPARLAALSVTLSRAAGRAVDLVELGGAPPLLRFEVARDGIVMLERHPHLWADFRAHAMVDWWEWKPLARRFGEAAAAALRAETAHGPC